jgi:glyoxylase-like metal-dependent hydrolase (beta-lactamase superfamily II)
MNPLSVTMIIVLGLIWLATLALKFPTLLLGLLIQPLANRFNWIVEFLYPTGIGRWVHFMIIRMVDRTRKAKPNDKSYGYHTRTIESRFEVVKDRVFVHPLPQLMDNLGYLVVCVPRPDRHDDDLSGKHHHSGKIVAFVVDCGDAAAVARQVALISNVHYNMRTIHIQSILSTHKHHDHTAGNKGLLENKDLGGDIKLVFGGAVEKVPQCNFLLANGDKLPLPREGRNDMRSVIEVEAIATPGHTRGSLAYALRPICSEPSSVSTIMFTGDTMFSGGGGVPFEADFDKNQDDNDVRLTGDSYIKASAATNAVERCFAEILFRSVPVSAMQQVTSDRILVFPGHEYSYELLNRQLTQPTENCRWKNFSPTVFFETVSHYYVAMHRRTLPSSGGKLLMSVSSVSRELLINPNLRSLKKRGEVVLSAIRLWNRHFAKSRVGDEIHGAFGKNGSLNLEAKSTFKKSRATERQWNLDAHDLNTPIFTTVYSADLNSIIEDLDKGKIDPQRAAFRLRQLKTLLDVPVVGRRPIPGTLPSDRTVYKGLLGLALLGSSPTALTPSDSPTMKLPPPIAASSDMIIVSKKRLISVLYWLGLLTKENEGKRTVAMIEKLWKEAREYESTLPSFDETSVQNDSRYASVDLESSATGLDDKVDLGSLKWIIYGVPSQNPTYFPKFCMPCAKPVIPDEHPIHKSGMEKEHGELVRHDIFTCFLCKGATGCPQAGVTEEVDAKTGKTCFLIRQPTGDDEDDEDESAYIEVTPDAMVAILREA